MSLCQSITGGSMRSDPLSPSAANLCESGSLLGIVASLAFVGSSSGNVGSSSSGSSSEHSPKT